MKSSKLLVAIVGLLALAMGSPGLAVAATPSPTTAGAAPAGLLTLPPNLPSNWLSLAPSQLAAYGILPGSGAAAAGATTATTATTATIEPSSAQSDLGFSPASHTGCQIDTCINVQGSGLQVDSWTTSANVLFYTCTYAIYLVGDSNYWTSPQRCGTSLYDSSLNWDMPLTFDNGTELCSKWVGLSGLPCATVHS